MVDEFTTPEIIREARKPIRDMPLGFPEKTVAPEPLIPLLHLRVNHERCFATKPHTVAEEGSAWDWVAERRAEPARGCRSRMRGSGATVFSGKPRGMPLMGFLASLMISGVVNSFLDLSPLWRRLGRPQLILWLPFKRPSVFTKSQNLHKGFVGIVRDCNTMRLRKVCMRLRHCAGRCR